MNRGNGGNGRRRGGGEAVAASQEDAMIQQRVERNQQCHVCSRIPYQSTDMLMPMMAAEEEGANVDTGLYDYIYQMTQEGEGGQPLLEGKQHHPKDDTAYVDEVTAQKTMERCARHIRRLQTELHKQGILQTRDQRFVGSGRSQNSPNRQHSSGNNNNNSVRVLAPLDLSEIRIGSLLGTGGFSSVYEVAAIRPNEEFETQLSKHEKEARNHLSKHAQRAMEASDKGDGNKGSKTKQGQTESMYAIKHLRRGLTKEPDRFERAAIDLVLEAQLLLGMDHPNIVSMRGWGIRGVDAFRSGRHTAFFFVMDRLSETLESRIFAWRDSTRKYHSRLKLPWGKQKYSQKLDNVLLEKLQVALDMAAALEYMHNRRIINRDLKATNVGFDVHGELKLFDFGLSRLLPAKKEQSEDSYLMSRVGTKYYMAPEIRKKLPYNLSADVYSYGVCLWEVLSLGSPREALKKFKDHDSPHYVSNSTHCPLPFCKCWPQDLCSVLRSCLSIGPIHRPPVSEVRYNLEQVMDRLGHKPRRREHNRRRSTLRVDLASLLPGHGGGVVSDVDPTSQASTVDDPEEEEGESKEEIENGAPSVSRSALEDETSYIDNYVGRLRRTTESSALDEQSTCNYEDEVVETPSPAPTNDETDMQKIVVSRVAAHSFPAMKGRGATTESTKPDSEMPDDDEELHFEQIGET